MRYLILLVLAVVVSLAAHAQYVWIDAAGQKVFSDLPPPIDVPSKRILKQAQKPSSMNADTNKKINTEPSIEENKTNSVLRNADAVSESPKKDKDLEAVKKKNDEEVAAKKKIELEANQKIKAENCIRAKNAKTTLDSGVRLSHTNLKGEQGFMDDATRSVETKRLEGIIALDCK